MRTPFVFLIFIFFFASTIQAQDQVTLSFKEFFDYVKVSHPLIKQANLQLANGSATLLSAKGGFDPKIESSYSQKIFKEDPYYRLFSTNLNIPTPWGIEINSGYDRTSGDFLNPENSDPDNGLFYAGISIPLGRGLLIDNRRAQLRKANIYLQSTEIERQLMVNDVLLDASFAYLQWWERYEVYRVIQSALSNTLERHQGIVASALAGDTPFIDTLESIIQVQNLEISRDNSRIAYLNATITLSSFLWDEDQIPVLLSEEIIPEQYLVLDNSVDSIANSVEESIVQHPELRSYDFKLQSIEIDAALAREGLKPKAAIKYNLIADGGKNVISNITPNNHTIGLSFSMPLLFRKERAQLQKIDILREQTSYDRITKEAVIKAKIMNALNSWRLSIGQYARFQEIIDNYTVLMESEEILFDEGESSLFLINSRLKSLIEARIKMIEMVVKIKSAELKSYYSLGRLTFLPL